MLLTILESQSKRPAPLSCMTLSYVTVGGPCWISLPQRVFLCIHELAAYKSGICILVRCVGAREIIGVGLEPCPRIIRDVLVSGRVLGPSGECSLGFFYPNLQVLHVTRSPSGVCSTEEGVMSGGIYQIIR